MTLRHGPERASAALNEVRWFGEGKPLYTCSAVRTAHTDRWRENGEIEKEKCQNGLILEEILGQDSTYH